MRAPSVQEPSRGRRCASEGCSLALNRSVALIINIKENCVPQNSGVKLQARAAHDLTKRELLAAFSFFLFFSLLLQIPTSPCRYAHVNVTFFFVFSFRLFLFQS